MSNTPGLVVSAVAPAAGALSWSRPLKPSSSGYKIPFVSRSLEREDGGTGGGTPLIIGCCEVLRASLEIPGKEETKHAQTLTIRRGRPIGRRGSAVTLDVPAAPIRSGFEFPTVAGCHASAAVSPKANRPLTWRNRRLKDQGEFRKVPLCAVGERCSGHPSRKAVARFRHAKLRPRRFNVKGAFF